MIAGLMTPDAGRIALEGRALYDHDRGVNLPPQRRGVGMEIGRASCRERVS
jgi:molybdate transport system ATP-binding protein